MNGFIRASVRLAILSFLSTMPVMAQIDHGLNFNAPFAFYAGNVRMPAGAYRITQTDMDDSELLIESKEGKYAAFLTFLPTDSETPHAQTDVTFHRYGTTEYLNRIWIEGQNYGMRIDPTKSEKKAATTAPVVEHAIPAKKR